VFRVKTWTRVKREPSGVRKLMVMITRFLLVSPSASVRLLFVGFVPCASFKYPANWCETDFKLTWEGRKIDRHLALWMALKRKKEASCKYH
jgi:hypothetical protein